MKVAGVIAEFDPFHNGHAYFLRKVREITSADFIIVVMSGDFMQRGNIAVAGKRLRTEAALLNDADIVIELPLQYATASAETFAMGGVSILDSLGCVDVLCFGTEEADIEPLKEVANILASETDEFKESLNAHLREGMNYPAARMEAIKEVITPNGVADVEDSVVDILSKPNNILALEYLKALNKLNSKIKTINIKREAVDHDSSNTYGVYSSAKNIRQILQKTHSLDAVSAYLPENTLSLLSEHFCVDFPIFDDDMSSLMKYRLLMETEESMMQYADVNADLAHRIINKRNDFISVSQFTELIKTRNITYTRISRALLHMLLSIKKNDKDHYENESDDAPGLTGHAGYARILGFKKSADDLMDQVNDKSSIPVISKVADYKRTLNDFQRRMFDHNLRASDIYNLIVRDIYGTAISPDITSMAIANGEYVLL